jgi:methyl-accepting chemotaxis protein
MGEMDERVKFSIRARLLLIFLGLTTVALSTLGGITYFQVSRLAEDLQNDKLDSDMFSIAEEASREIDPNDVLALAESGEEGDPLYSKLRDQLMDISRVNPNMEANRVFIAIRGKNPDQIVFVVDTEESQLEHFELGETYAPEDSEQAILDGFHEPVINDNYFFLETDQGVELYAGGYAPLKDADGNPVAVIGVEMLAESAIDARWEVARTFLLTALGVYPILVAAILLVSTMISRPIRDIAKVAWHLEQDQPVDADMLKEEVHRSDELGQLARIFAKAIEEVQARQERLKEQVAELKIEIDLVKQKEQIDEITDSDFFRDLQAEKDKLRARRSGKGAGEASNKPTGK